MDESLQRALAQDPWAALRAQFPITDELAYFDHAAVAPLSRHARARMEAYLVELSTHGVRHYPRYPMQVIEHARRLGAGLMGARPDQVFMVRSTTQGIGIAATGIPMGEGDNVVLVEREFPANIRPWLPLRRRGVEVRLIPQRYGRVLLDDLAAAVDHRTAALSISFVQFLSGFRADLAPIAELCRRHNALFVVDAIQGLGVMELDVAALGIDLLAADSHKWLLGPEGAGLGFVSDRALERIEPALEGWLALEQPFELFDIDQPLKPTAARYEEGAYNLAGIQGMNGSLELLTAIGVAAVQRRILDLTDELCERLVEAQWTVLSPRAHDGEKSGIVLVTRDGVDLDALGRRLADAGVIVSLRGGALRIAPHAYNNRGDMDRLLEVLAAAPEVGQ